MLPDTKIFGLMTGAEVFLSLQARAAGSKFPRHLSMQTKRGRFPVTPTTNSWRRAVGFRPFAAPSPPIDRDYSHDRVGLLLCMLWRGKCMALGRHSMGRCLFFPARCQNDPNVASSGVFLVTSLFRRILYSARSLAISALPFLHGSLLWLQPTLSLCSLYSIDNGSRLAPQMLDGPMGPNLPTL